MKKFAQSLKISRAFMTQVKHHGGRIWVNDRPATVNTPIEAGGRLTLEAPDELGHETVPPSQIGIDIRYEDRDCLVVYKPSGIVSIPSKNNPDGSMANRIKGYYMDQAYRDQVIHIVTRLDRDTSGLMLVAKHRLAHAFFDQQLQAGIIQRQYQALIGPNDLPRHGIIEAPIGRDLASLFQRKVDPQGAYAKTEYWRDQDFNKGSLVNVKLHTGRTHQIRVHFQYVGYPLLGDSMYGGPVSPPLSRQALHCGSLAFIQPFSQEEIFVQADMPEDMQAVIDPYS